MRKWIAMVVVTSFVGSACAADYFWWGGSFGGDGVDFHSTTNWASPWATQATVLPGTNDLTKIQAAVWMISYPVLSGSATLGGLQLGLDNANHTPGASLTIESGASLTIVTNYSVTVPENFGVQMGWYSDASITSAGTVDTGEGFTYMGLGSAGNGFGSATLALTAGTWDTKAVIFGTSNSVNTVHLEGGILTTGDIIFDPASNGVNTVQIDGGTVEILAAGIGHLEKPNQTIDISGGTLLLHSTDAGIINFYKTVGLTGYGSGDNIVAVHSDTDADTTNDLWTVTAVDPATNVYWHGNGSLGGDQSSWEDPNNWSDAAHTSVVGAPTSNDIVKIWGISWQGSYPALSSTASVSSVQMGLISGSSDVAALNIAATGQLLTTDGDGINGGINIGWYSDAEVTSAGVVDTLNGAGADGPTLLGLGDAGNGYGNGTLNITGGSWTTPYITFNTNSANHVQLDGGTLNVWALNNLNKADQTMDIVGGTLYHHTADTTWFASARTNGLTGYGSPDNLVGSHNGSTWTVTAAPPATFSLYDVEWATTVAWWGDHASSTLDSKVDIAGDPGYEFTCTASNFMMFGVDADVIIGSNWTVRLKNSGTLELKVSQVVVTNWPAIIKDESGAAILAPGEAAVLSVDVSAYTSIEKLGLMFEHTSPGAARTLKAQVIEPIPPVVDLNLLDVHWETATDAGWPVNAGSSLDGSADVAGDPGYEFTCTVAGWGLMFGVDSEVIGTLTPGLWEVWITNTSAVELAFEQVAYTNGSATPASANGGAGIPLAPGASALFSWDLSAAMSIEKLGITAGISGTGAGIITFQMVEEPPPSPAHIVLTDAQWETATEDWGTPGSTFDGGVDVAGDPGYEFTCTVSNAADWMIFGVDMGGVTGETWEVTVENSGADAMSVRQGVWVSDGLGGASTLLLMDPVAPLDLGERVTLTADISTNASIERLSLVYFGADGGGVQAKAKVLLPSLAAYEAWAAGFPGMGGLTDDDENGGLGDGMDNLMEYAFGGDPLVDDMDIYGPVTVSAGGDTYVYVYRRRIDAAARGLEYDLLYKADLITDSDWLSVTGFFETTGILDADFEAVTNSIPTIGLDRSFLKLDITENF